MAEEEDERIAAGPDLNGRVTLLAVGEDGHAYWLDDAPWSVWRHLGLPFGTSDFTLGEVRGEDDMAAFQRRWEEYVRKLRF